MALATSGAMDANAALTNLTAALAAPANAAPAPASQPAPNRSFAATLAREQPPAHEAPRPASRPQAPAASASDGNDQGDGQTDPAPGATKTAADADSGPKQTAGAKRPARAKGSGGDDSPPDGKTLPVWLTPPIPTASPAVTAASTSASTATAAAADAAAVATGTAGTDAASASAPAIPTLGTDARADAGRAPHEAAQPSFEAAAALAGAQDADDAEPAPAAKPVPAAPDAAATPAPARAEAGIALARLESAPESTAPAPTPAAAPVEAPRVAATISRPSGEPVATASRAPRLAGVRAGESAPEAPATATRAQDIPPVAPELRRAVTAMQASDAKVDVVDLTAKAPSAADLTGAATIVPALDRGAATTAPATAQVATPVGSPDWAHELSDRVSVLVDQNLTHAQIKLAPADLGPIEVRIAVSDGQANISFTTHSHVTSEALQAAAPRLREALGAQGYASVNVDVAQQQFRERTPQQSRYEPEAGPGAAPAATASRAVGRPSAGSAALRLDAYA
ncbi:MAG: flagellar hook-length control protein FliK [Proteobacteria bacterium]|nr:flagellar hook-length control protein FliK [Pseudomonadota bacterium]